MVRKLTLAMLGVLALALACAPVAARQGFRAGDLTISDVWARPTVGSSDTTAVYLTITNSGQDADRLTGASTSAASSAELHTMTTSGGMMRMREVDAIEISAGGSIALAPGGDHIMVIGLKTALRMGDRLELTLTFEHAGKVDVEAPVHN